MRILACSLALMSEKKSISLLFASLLLSATAHAIPITITGDFLAEPDSDLSPLSGSFSLTVEVNGVGLEEFDEPLDFLELTPSAIGATTFTTSNSSATFVFQDGSPLGALWVGGTTTGTAGISTDTDDWAVSWVPLSDLGAPHSVLVSVASESSTIGEDTSPTGSLTIIPEPTTALLLATGLAGLAAAGRRRSLH
jgi:hypothetical protein